MKGFSHGEGDTTGGRGDGVGGSCRRPVAAVRAQLEEAGHRRQIGVRKLIERKKNNETCSRGPALG